MDGAKFEPNGLFNELYFNNLFPSPCDARLYKYFNIPTVICGPGSLEQAHSLNEFIHTTSIVEFINIFSKELSRYFGICITT